MCRRDRGEKFCYRYDKNIIGDGYYWLRLPYTFKLTIFPKIGFLVLSNSLSVIFHFFLKKIGKRVNIGGEKSIFSFDQK